MIKTNHHSQCGRVAITFLLLLAVFSFWAPPASATLPCDSDIIYENHTPEPGEDVSEAPPPIPDFCPYPVEGCDSVLVEFTDYSLGYIYTWEWDFGDPASGADNYSNEESPSHWYHQSGVYTVTMTVTGPGGTASVTKDQTITVISSPTADFIARQTTGCAPFTVYFEDRSTFAHILLWSFGDGDYAATRNPVHIYAAPGTYTVRLTVWNDCGRDKIIKELYITVQPPPIADFTSDKTEDCEGGTVTFTDLSQFATSWEWDFGDGAGSYDQHPVHRYTIPGIYTVTLTAFNDCGDDVATKKEYITIHPKPIADFTADITLACVGETINLTDLSSYPDTWYWEFGDGADSYDQHPAHAYSAVGTYTVTLTVENRCGPDTEQKEYYITVIDGPTADFTSDQQQLCVGADVMFTDLSIDADTWQWDFGDGSPASPVQHPTHTYTVPGTYDVSLTVTNRCGDDTETRVEYITVLPGPTAEFTVDHTEICVGETVSFTDLSIGALTWSWDFGNGSGSPAQHPQQTYLYAGLYTVSLTVTGDCGKDTETKVDYIWVRPGPIADFTSDKTESCTGATVTFTDLSIDADTWYWEFGDRGTSTDQHPSHIYAHPGVYPVSLTVTNGCGPDTETKLEYIRVIGPPMADFTSDRTEACTGADITFTDLSTNADTWEWDFGDGTATSPVQHPTHVYSVPGVYTVSLTVTNPCGEDTETKPEYITIHVGPEADFYAVPISGLVPLDVDFTDMSTSDLGITDWLWDFGDGADSYLPDPRHTYTDTGHYTVSLTVTDPCGKDVATKVQYIYVYDTCRVDFSAEPTEGCAELTVYFYAEGTGPCDISSWTWDFGDPASGNDNTGTGQTPIHTYASPGVYTVTVTAADATGDIVITKTDYITVYGGPTADFVASPTEGIDPLTVNFTDQSISPTGMISWTWDFGDPSSGSGNSSAAQNPVHVFQNPGLYTITMIVEDACGADTAETDITVRPAITITKAVDAPVARPGEEIQYTLTVANNSLETVYNVLVVDTIPDSTGYVDNSITGGGTFDSRLDLVSWSVPVVDPGASLDFTFRVHLDGPFTIFPTTISNFAVATIDFPEPIAASLRTFVSNIVTTLVEDGTPLGPPTVRKEVSATLASPGDPLTYTLIIENDNPTPVDDVEVFDAIPDHTTYVNGTITGGGNWDMGNDSLSWYIGTMNPYEMRSFAFQVDIDTDCDNGQRIPNTALVTSEVGGEQSNEVITAVSLVPIVVTKKVNRPSAMLGDLLRYTITVENFSSELFLNAQLIDTMPAGIFYVDGTSRINGVPVADPTGTNPLEWLLGNLPASATLTVEYTGLVGASAAPGINENVARAEAFSQGGLLVRSNRAIAQVYVLSQTLSGAIRGQVVVDCDGDGVADIDTVPSGMDVYLDDGSQSRVNEKGMFYFSTVRAGEHAVMLDERDLEGYYIPEDAPKSVFVHVHETGESYVIFRVCPEYPQLDIRKEAAIVPTVKVTKKAKLNAEQTFDSLGVLIDYQIDIKSNGLADPTQVRVVDSLPESTQLVLDATQALIPKRTGEELVYEVTAAQERLQKSVYYSLRDLTPGLRRFLSNKIHLEGDPTREGEGATPIFSDPVEVAAGPFLLVPPQDVQVTLTPALFITSMADLQAPAIPQLEAVADSIMKYADAEIKVEGHTDHRPIHTEQFPSNWELGEERAKAVVEWLVTNRGIDRDRLKWESFAATQPVVTVGTTSEELQPNRRTEVIIKAKLAGYVNPAALPADNWESSTTLALDPVKFGNSFETADAQVEIGLDDSWEILLIVENTGAVVAENTTLSDVLPEGVEYIANSATIDGKSVAAEVVDGTLTVKLDTVAPSQKIELRYRVRALAGSTPSGGGAASIEVRTYDGQPVIHKSNAVRFE